MYQKIALKLGYPYIDTDTGHDMTQNTTTRQVTTKLGHGHGEGTMFQYNFTLILSHI